MSEHIPKPAEPSIDRSRRQLPLMIAICMVAIIAGLNLIDFGDFNGGPLVRLLSDKALVNILSLSSGLIAAGFISYWFFTYSGASKKILTGLGAVLVIAVVTSASCFRVEAVRGDLRPEFRWRWAKSPDQELAPIVATPKIVDLKPTSPADFPQFLGPNGALVVRGRRLSADWSSQPPTQKWSRRIGAGWSAFSAVNGFALTQEQRGDEELVSCYDIESGEIVWTNAISGRHETTMGYVGPRATPTIHSGDVFTLGATGMLQRIDGESGKTIWKRDLLSEKHSDPGQEAQSIAWGRSGSPLIYANLVIVPLGGPKNGAKASLAAFDTQTGEKKWEAGNRQASYASPKFVNLRSIGLILSVNEDSVSAHIPETGKQAWEHAWQGSSTSDANCSQPNVINDDSIMVTKGYGQGSMLIRLLPLGDTEDRFTSEVVWANNRALRTKFTNVAVAEDFAYGLSDGLLQCVNARTGEIEWKGKTRFGNGQVLAVDNLLLVQSESGEITLVSLHAEKFQVLGSFQGLDPNSGACWNNLCLYGNLLLIRNSQQAACWELPVVVEQNVANGG